MDLKHIYRALEKSRNKFVVKTNIYKMTLRFLFRVYNKY